MTPKVVSSCSMHAHTHAHTGERDTHTNTGNDLFDIDKIQVATCHNLVTEGFSL